MLKNAAFSFLSIIFFVFLLSLLFSQQSFAQPRLYQCSPAFDYATAIANCSSGPPVDCVNPTPGPNFGTTRLVANGNTCAADAADYYSIVETGVVGNLTGACNDKCTDIPLTKICSPDAFNNCPVTNFTCQGQVGSPVTGAGDKTFCIQYTVVPTPTPTPTGTPTPTRQ